MLVFIISLGIALFLGEMAMRWMIFKGGDAFAQLRRPEYFADISEDAYWKLYHEFGGEYQPPEKPHPILGWVGAFDRVCYMHHDLKDLEHRRPVLLYGDSFAQCVPEVDCFEDILNADSNFTRANYMLNYGVGGYGVGQAALLCSMTAPRYDRPLVVFSMLTTDIDRTLLSVRTGQKPYFDLEDGHLQLKGLPIDPDPEHFFEENPPEITSYLYRRFTYSDLNVLPYRIRSRMRNKYYFIEKKQAVNEVLIKRVAAELRAAEIDFVFMVFHFEDDMMSPNSEKNWRDQFFRRVLDENQIPYIWSKDIIRAHRKAHPENHHDAYIIPGNGHPTTLYNQLISAEIQKVADQQPWPQDFQRNQESPYYFESQIEAMKVKLARDSTWMRRVSEKAQAEGRSLDRQIHLDAVFMVKQELQK